MTWTESPLVDPSFPIEVLLEILQHVPYTLSSIQTLELTHPRIHAALRSYQRSISKAYADRFLRHAEVDFPRQKNEDTSFAWLSKCIRKYDVADHILDVLTSRGNWGRLGMHNMGMCYAGLLLLYRIVELDEHSDKAAFINSLPLDPSTALLTFLDHARMTARYHSPGLINLKIWGAQLRGLQITYRNMLEFAFVEAALTTHGPNFIQDTMEGREEADTTLMNVYHEHATQDWDENTLAKPWLGIMVTEGPHRAERHYRDSSPALYGVLLARMALLMGCGAHEVEDRIASDVHEPGHSLANLDLRGKARLVNKLDMDYRESEIV
ncbi:hypothetical protein M011DRAFT_445280 [Sporormia fimetaria CBS 119925]|uniref:Uncharacterized protein n=1 Tax=Sporormia fimetaria CBS 119925 TaxID=1340428 RepID=A0A6A6V773_9PLEO|nr:hypothetical protein M011DRAFT_445280 [Sporormia fimetaria CBS 119925]